MKGISPIEFYKYTLWQKIRKHASLIKEQFLLSWPSQMAARLVASRSSTYIDLVAKTLFAYPERNMSLILQYLRKSFLNPSTSSRKREKIICDLCSFNYVDEALRLHEEVESREKNQATDRWKECINHSETKHFLRNYKETMDVGLRRKSIGKIYSLFPEKKVPIDGALDALMSGHRVVITCMRGPADEAFYACTLRYLGEDDRFDSSNITILCDQRMIGILKRSFPDLNFFPVQKKKYVDFGDYAIFRDLPDIRMHTELCGRSYRFVSSQDKVLHPNHILYLYKDRLFSEVQQPYLVPDPKRIAELKPFFPEGYMYAGVMWKGTINKINRRIFYYDLEHFLSIFALEGFRFVVLDQNLSREERRILKRYGDKIIIARDLFDLYNDFETLAATYHYLEFVVGSGSFNIMFAAPFGCQTFLLVTSARNNSYIMPDGSYMSLGCTKSIQSPDGRYDRHATVKQAIAEIEDYLATRG